MKDSVESFSGPDGLEEDLELEVAREAIATHHVSNLLPSTQHITSLLLTLLLSDPFHSHLHGNGRMEPEVRGD